MQAVLKLFRGEVTLADRPEQIIDLETESDDVAAPRTTVPVVDPDTPTTTADSVPTTELVPLDTLPVVETVDIVYGAVPDSNISCT